MIGYTNKHPNVPVNEFTEDNFVPLLEKLAKEEK